VPIHDARKPPLEILDGSFDEFLQKTHRRDAVEACPSARHSALARGAVCLRGAAIRRSAVAKRWGGNIRHIGHGGLRS